MIRKNKTKIENGNFKKVIIQEHFRNSLRNKNMDFLKSLVKGMRFLFIGMSLKKQDLVQISQNQ